MRLDPSRDEPDTTLDLPEVSKHNCKSRDIKQLWQEPLEQFVRGRREVARAALTDPDHPRSVLWQTLPSSQAEEFLNSVDGPVNSSTSSTDGATTVVSVTPDCPLDSERILEREAGPLDILTERGVPDCCATAYERHEANGYSDPIAGVAKNTPSTSERGGELVVESPHYILNPMWAFQGWGFVDFYPCSFECDKAREVAAETGRLFREIGYGRAADALFEFLTAPTYWSGYHGLAHVKSSWCVGEYTTDDYWHEKTVRFGGYHDDYGDVDSVDFTDDETG